MTADAKTPTAGRTLPNDKPLRSRVKLFGNLLGQILHEHAGRKVFEAVEALRKGHISLRKSEDARKRQRLAQLIESLDPDTLAHVIRAFSIYFSLVNIAEESFQHKQRRREVSRNGPLWVGSFDHTLRQFHGEGIPAEKMQHLLDHLAYIPVFTAHPTEAKRRTIAWNGTFASSTRPTRCAPHACRYSTKSGTGSTTSASACFSRCRKPTAIWKAPLNAPMARTATSSTCPASSASAPGLAAIGMATPS